MINKYYDQDCNLGMLDGKTVAIIGFGSQGHAHAMNLKESGVDVVVGLRPGSAHVAKAEAAGLKVLGIEEAAEAGNVVMMLVPDELAPAIYKNQIAKHMKEGDTLMFAHGFNIHYSQIQPADYLDVSMVAPKGPGHIVRACIHRAAAYAAAIGAGRAGILETTFKEETETDLFGEQAVLCGGVCELMTAGFETLVAAGYEPEMAYFECIHEMKLIVDLIYEGGFDKMRYSISNTAEYGDYVTGKRIITKESREGMKQVLAEIQDGTFASTFVQEMNAGGKAKFLTSRKKAADHQLCHVGKELREMMSWLKK